MTLHSAEPRKRPVGAVLNRVERSLRRPGYASGEGALLARAGPGPAGPILRRWSGPPHGANPTCTRARIWNTVTSIGGDAPRRGDLRTVRRQA